jgi:hypothetical protein
MRYRGSRIRTGRRDEAEGEFPLLVRFAGIPYARRSDSQSVSGEARQTRWIPAPGYVNDQVP